MKRIYSLMVTAIALLVGVASCQVISEDAFSTDPVAPEMYDHSDILMTTNTMDEDVNFSWKPYRNLPEGLNYSLYMSYEGKPALLNVSTALFYKVSKEDFKEAVYSAFPDLPENDAFAMAFWVSVESGGKEFKSNELSLKIYASGDAVAPVVEEVVEEVVLDPADPEGKITLMTWEPARLVYGELVTYDVYVSLAPTPNTKAQEGDEEETENKKIKLTETPIETTTLITTVDNLNEAVVAAGGVEEAENSVVFTVVAYCESLPNGVPSRESEPVEVSTYLATFPDAISVVGDLSETGLVLQHSSKVKGTYEAALVIAKQGSENATFTLESDLGKFGGVVEVDSYGENPVNYVVNGTVSEDADAIVVPGGMYYVKLNMKLKTLQMIQINSLSVIGAAVGGWDADHEVDLKYDPDKKRFEAVATLTKGEYKIRFNHDWTYAFAEDPSWLQLGAEAKNLSNNYEGEYRVFMNVGKAPFTVSMVNANLPENVYMVGADFGGWNWDSDGVVELIPVVYNPDWGVTNTEGQFWTIRYLTAGNGVKFNGARAWDGNQFGSLATNDGFENDKDGNLVVAESGNYMIHMDLVNGILHVEPARVYGIGTCFGGWDEGMEDALFVADGKKLKITVPAAGEIRMYAASSIATSDWWTREFVFFDGKIAYRGNAGDQERVRVFKDKVITLDFNAGTATVTGEGEGPQAPETVSLIGTLNNTTWDTDFDMETLDGETWTIKGVSLTANDMFKIRENHDWAVSYGGPEATGKVGDDDVYTPELGKEFATGSNNICVGKEGKYTITFKWDAEHPTILIEEYKEFPEHLYMTGTDFGNWFSDQSGVVELTPVLHNPDWGANAEAQFWTVRYFKAASGFKFNSAPSWDGNDFNSLETNEGFTVSDGNCFVPSDGFYMVHIDCKRSILHIEPAKVRIVGDCTGLGEDAWNEEKVAAEAGTLFEAADGPVLKLTLPAGGNLRMYATSTIATSAAWTREFNIYDGVIAYRGTGGDQEAVPVLKNQVVTLDFNAGTGSISGEGEAPTLPETMFIIGDAIIGWNDFVPMHAFHSQDGMFWIIRYLEADKPFKFSPVAAWTGDFNKLDTNEGFEIDGGNCKVTESGIYCIGVDCANSKIIVEPAKVYGIGVAFGGWDVQNVAFQVVGQTLVGTATADGNIRTYVDSKLLSSVDVWWHAEFIPKDGSIVYREKGGDPAEVAITAGQKITYDFNAGTAVVE